MMVEGDRGVGYGVGVVVGGDKGMEGVELVGVGGGGRGKDLGGGEGEVGDGGCVGRVVGEGWGRREGRGGGFGGGVVEGVRGKEGDRG